MTGRSLILLVAAGIGCAPSPGDDVLLLLSIDTLRADRLGVGGDPSARTPFLDRLARGGHQFAVALTPVPLTLPAHATILSGLAPPDHGARDNGLFRVPEDVPLISESFLAAGWTTAAFVAALPLAARFGLDRGFATYHDTPGTSFPQRPAGAVNRDVFDWLDTRQEGAPLFLWVHYFDPHTPYEPPPPLSRVAGQDRYRGEIMYADRQADVLVRELERGFDDLRVCVTADHGESLGQHGEATHGVFIYEATTRVPLLLHGTGMKVGIDPRPTPTSRIAPMLLAWAGIEDARIPITPDTNGDVDGACYMESLYPRYRHGWSELRGLRSDRWKVIQAPEPEVFDLDADPGELRNVYAQVRDHPDVAGLLREVADSRWAGRAQLEEPGPEVTAALESLGYVAPSRVDPGPGGELPDPKHRIRLEYLLGEGFSALEAGNLGAARALLSRALSIESRDKETQLLRARVEAASGATDRAFEVFAYCLELPPAELDGSVHYEAGRVALDAGRLDRAEESFARAVAADPLNLDALFNWGVTAYRAERYHDAAQRWRRALELDPGHPPSLRWLPDVEARLAEGPGS